ncbi:hypothetical protein HPB50_023165 [Hyalomma asiaticum]|uniref:Uncharacterized protein n=1 Tax=Hyalomma asiaticum TaxID=266040 RepID=A0ACB7TB49_HYAAI|nr:hypothetical protein HPB50_023165 [Hyalomma asiaticum]
MSTEEPQVVSIRCIVRVLIVGMSMSVSLMTSLRSFSTAVQEQMKQRLHELEAIFSENLAYINWVDNMRAVLARYQLKRYPTLHFGFPGNNCAPFNVHRDVEPLSFYQQISEQQQAMEFISASVPVAWWSRSELSTWPSPDWSRRTVQVPAALFNLSVVEGAPFSLHASRYSVRLYRALVELLLFPTDADVADAGEWLGDRGRALRSLLGCFEWDIRQLPMPLRNLVAPEPDASRGSALQQTVALQLAFRAYQKLMRRKGNRDFRYRALSNLSSAQLFFIYYALDNCESGDVVYAGHLGHMLPASYRVNVAVRHVLEFWDAFQCPEGSAMTQLTLAAACSVVRQDAWYRSLQVD